jgi:prophage regulatory protein
MPSLADFKAPLRILRLREVRERTGQPTSVIYDQMSREEFPRPVPIGPRSVGWVEHEIETWIRDRIAARDAGDTWTSLSDVAGKIVAKVVKKTQK